MLFGSSKKSSADPASLAMQIVVSALLFLASLASLVGLVLSHVNLDRGTLTFGSSGGSLAILAFAVTVSLWSHSMMCLLAPDAPKKK